MSTESSEFFPFKDAWAVLLEDLPHSAGKARDVASFAWGTALAGLHAESQERVIAYCFNEIPEFPPSFKSVGGFDVIQSIDREKSCYWVMIPSAANSDPDIFEALGEDLYAHLKLLPDGISSEHAIIALRARLTIWAKFFRKRSEFLHLSEAEERGLVGELICIQKLIEETKAPANEIVQAWQSTGKDAEVDFKFSRVSIEVKTCGEPNLKRYHISSGNQLDETLHDRLLLYTVDLLRSPDGVTLRELLEDTVLRFPEAERGVFENKFAEVWAPPSLIEDTQFRWVVDAKEEYEVSNDFPRITHKTSHQDVLEIKYEIVLKRYPSSDQLIRRIFEEIYHHE